MLPLGKDWGATSIAMCFIVVIWVVLTGGDITEDKYAWPLMVVGAIIGSVLLTFFGDLVSDILRARKQKKGVKKVVELFSQENGVALWNQFRHDNADKIPDLSNVSFEELTDLSGVNFSNTNLVNANFNYAILVNANFSGSHVDNADFSNADLRKTSFTGASLSNTNFSNADLRGAYFNDARLHETDFTGADLSTTLSLMQSKLEFYSFKSLYDAKIHPKVLEVLKLRNIRLHGL